MQLFFKILFMSAHLLIKFLNLTKRKIHIHTIARSENFLLNTDAAAFNPNGTKMLLADGLSAFFIQGKPVFSNGTRNLPRILPDCPILYN